MLHIYIYIYIYIKNKNQKQDMMNYISNINRFLNLKIIPVAFHSQTSTMCVDKAFYKKFTNTTEIKNLLNELTKQNIKITLPKKHLQKKTILLRIVN